MVDGFPGLFVGDLVGTVPSIGGETGRTQAGLGYVFYNAATLRGLIFDMNSPPADVKLTKVYGHILGAIGADTMAHGDFVNDGIADLACGNPHDAPQMREGAGSVHVFYGQPGGWPEIIDLKEGNLPDLAEMRIVRIDGGAAHDTLCYSASAGLIDGDNHVDLIINEMTGNGIPKSVDGMTTVSVDVGNMVILSGAGKGSAPASNLSFQNGNLLDFEKVEVGGEASTMVVIVRSSSGVLPECTGPLIVGPEAEAYEFVVANPFGAFFIVGIKFTPTTAGPHGAALVLESDEPVPLRLGLRVIGSEAACIEADFYDFGGSSLLRFGGDFEDDYELLSKESLNLNRWESVKMDLRNTGGWIYLHDSVVSASTLRRFYKVRRSVVK